MSIQRLDCRAPLVRVTAPNRLKVAQHASEKGTSWDGRHWLFQLATQAPDRFALRMAER